MRDKISIAIATYNGEKYLREQLDSLYTQTFIPNEVIAVDDCSTDNTITILEEYHQKYGLIYHINDATMGVNKNFEKAINLCSNDYIALCDQDDVWLPHKIETSYLRLKSIENNLPSLVSSRCINVDANLKLISKPITAKDSDSYITTLLGHHSQGCSLMMNRALLKYILPFPMDNKIIFDGYIGLIAAMVGNKYNIAETLMYYRHHQSNLFGMVNMRQKSFFLRLKNRYSNRYPKFASETRLYHMKIIADLKSHYFVSNRTLLYYKFLSLDHTRNLFRKVFIIFSIKEVPFSKRCVSIGDTIISHIFSLISRNIRSNT